MEYYNYRMTGGALIAGDRYVYDALGNITEIQESEPASGSSVRRTKVRYTYDDQNQLKTETHYTYSSNTDTTGTAVTSTYTYDTAGNMLSSSDGTNTLTYTYGDSSWNDLLTEINNQPIIYDACGNPTTYSNGEDSFLFSWTEGRRLTTLENPEFEGTVIYSYNYDSNGVRTAKVGKLDKHSYQTLNRKVVLERVTLPKRQKRVLHFIYDESGRPFALNYSTDGTSFTTYYYVLNLQGDVVKLVEADGTLVAEYSYDAWGKVLSATGSMASINPLRYRGYYYDGETGFYYLQSRYYDPANRRFINADTYASTGQGFIGANMFAYCNNNPLIFADSSGYAIDPRMRTTVCNDGGYNEIIPRLFPTEEEAVVDFAKDYFFFTKAKNIEYGAIIYSTNYHGQDRYFYGSVSYGGNETVSIAPAGAGLSECMLGWSSAVSVVHSHPYKPQTIWNMHRTERNCSWLS